MNTNLTLSEIVTIAVVILIVFGPHRLPDMARRAGELVAKLRDAAGALRNELTAEYGEAAKPFKDIEADLKAAKDELKGLAGDLTRPPPHPVSDGAPPTDATASVEPAAVPAPRGEEAPQDETPPASDGGDDDGVGPEHVDGEGAS